LLGQRPWKVMVKVHNAVLTSVSGSNDRSPKRSLEHSDTVALFAKQVFEPEAIKNRPLLPAPLTNRSVSTGTASIGSRSIVSFLHTCDSRSSDSLMFGPNGIPDASVFQR